ncbi:hypothetical protein [Candidatus Magnetomonas plexicatena]|uniref:hypothetical protein n=1 Tax=Candidatus Magnetomonas plexicatena TaxID=2552947 RepID=UPI0011023CA4|nr:hypothetical protein E2O03_011640 [Nitrospirales bacterium LBB_01]
MIETAIDVNPDVERIHEMLAALSVERIKEASDFIAFLVEKERKHQAFVEETLAAEQRGEYYTFETVEEAMDAIRNWKD